MDVFYPVIVGALFAVSAYLLLSDGLPRMALGLIALSNAAHLLIFGAGRLSRGPAPIVVDGAAEPALGAANALPQALILTAIVISFALFAFIVTLIMRASHALKTDATDSMNLADPALEPASNAEDRRS